MMVLLLCVDISKLIIYYTDWHNVDEDMVTLVYHGGRWQSATNVGVTYRDTDETPTHVSDTIASSNMKNSQIIRIFIMSTKILRLLFITVVIGANRAQQVSRNDI